MKPIKKGMSEAVTRDGRQVTQLTWFEGVEVYSVVGVIDGRISYWLESGKVYKTSDSDLDIFTPDEYEWQWLVRHVDGTFKATYHFKSEYDLKNFGGYVQVNGWTIVSRIEESKREVQS